MQLLPIFVNAPAAHAFQSALETIKNAGVFSIHVAPLDGDVLKLAFDVSPCICVFSINSFNERQKIKDLLQIIKPLRKSSVRVLILAEGDGITMEGWGTMSCPDKA